LRSRCRFSGSCDMFCCNLLVADCRLATCMLHVASCIAVVIGFFNCFEVKPRRRRGDDDESTKKRKSFRLCICEDDRSRLLNADAWPNSIITSDWYFKNPREEAAINTTTGVNGDTNQMVAAAASAQQLEASASATIIEVYMDCTINGDGDIDF